MPILKQAILCLAILTAAALVWLSAFPGADGVLARVGIDREASREQTATRTRTQGARPPGRGGRAGPVVTAPVSIAVVNDHAMAIGTGRALRSVMVTPTVSGTLTEMRVVSGAIVRGGDVMARLDAESEQIAHDRAIIGETDAQERLERIMALRSSNTATRVQQSDAELALRNAELALREAKLALERRTIRAPIEGTVGILPQSLGTHVSAGTEIATIDDRSRIRVDFWIPERFASLVQTGMPVTATVIARPELVHQGRVSAVDNRVDAASRTLRVEATIDNPDDRLRAGMAFAITLRFPGDTFPAVDPRAVQWSAEGPYVWAFENDAAHRLPVSIIQRNADTVLIQAPGLTDGDKVAVEGLHNIQEGMRIASDSSAPTESSP